MTPARIAIIDPAAGISGDMLLGALVDAGAPAAWLQGLPDRLGIGEQVTVSIERVMRCGISCAKVNVRLADGSMEHPSDAVVAPHTHDHAAHGTGPHRHDPHAGLHGHRHVADLVAIVERADLSAAVRARALQAFRSLGEAEGKLHGVPWDQVHLHEVGAMDALVDIVGGIEGFERLGVQKVYARPVALG
ncbi:MAG TPA: nickel insertion protein, partial [Gemmatimonadales bacterium]|nr:nickel insertion protein [Gemmatimonadales bacterium]